MNLNGLSGNTCTQKFCSIKLPARATYLGRTRCDRGVVSDLKAVRMSCCCTETAAQLFGEAFDIGGTEVDLNSVGVSVLADICRRESWNNRS